MYNKKALAAGEGPDILFFDSAYYSQFTTGEYLEDLLKEPYYAGRYEKDFRRIYGKAINHLTEASFGNDFPDITRCDFLPGGCNGGKRFRRNLKNLPNLLKKAKILWL